jgi:hypothetical protein
VRLYFFALFARLLAKLAGSLANWSAIRFFAAASDAFLARAELSSAVIVSRLRFPPFAPISRVTPRSRARCLNLRMH